jgi:hypothetical protein
MVGVRQGAVAVGALCLSVAFASAAHGAGEPDFGCKKVHRGKATVDPNTKGRAPLAIGDSTMLLPIPNLAAVGYSVNARGCRGFREAINIARKLKAKHHLPHLVLINAYGNGGVNPTLIQDALSVLGRRRVLGLVSEYNADTGHPPAPDLRPRLGQVQPLTPRRGAEAGRLVPARPLPPELHGGRRLRPVPGYGATAGDDWSLPTFAVDPAAVFVAAVYGEAGSSQRDQLLQEPGERLRAAEGEVQTIGLEPARMPGAVVNPVEDLDARRIPLAGVSNHPRVVRLPAS